MNSLGRSLAQIYKRVPVGGDSIENMPDDYKRGWYAGVCAGRDAQRDADLKVAKHELLRSK